MVSLGRRRLDGVTGEEGLDGETGEGSNKDERMCKYGLRLEKGDTGKTCTEYRELKCV